MDVILKTKAPGNPLQPASPFTQFGFILKMIDITSENVSRHKSDHYKELRLRLWNMTAQTT